MYQYVFEESGFWWKTDMFLRPVFQVWPHTDIKALPDSPSGKAAYPTPGSAHSQCTVFSEGDCSQEFRPSGHHAFCVSALLALVSLFLDLFIWVLAEVFRLSLLKSPYVCVPGGRRLELDDTLPTLKVPNIFPFLALPSHSLPHCWVQNLPEPFTGAYSIVR